MLWGTVVHACNPSICEAGEFEASLDCTARVCLKTSKQKRYIMNYLSKGDWASNIDTRQEFKRKALARKTRSLLIDQEKTSIKKFTSKGTVEAQPQRLESRQAKHLCNGHGLKHIFCPDCICTGLSLPGQKCPASLWAPRQSTMETHVLFSSAIDYKSLV